MGRTGFAIKLCVLCMFRFILFRFLHTALTDNHALGGSFSKMYDIQIFFLPSVGKKLLLSDQTTYLEG